MERNRVIAAAPARSASEAWRILVELIADTLGRSPLIEKGGILKELEVLNGLGPALIAGGHFEGQGLVLIDEQLHVTLRVVTADPAFDVEENLNPIPGGANSEGNWMLHFPSAGPLDSVLQTAIKKSSHLTMATPPARAPETSVGTDESSIDIDALRRMAKKS